MNIKIVTTTVVFCVLLAALIFVAAQETVDSPRKAAEFVRTLGWLIDNDPVEKAEIDIPPQFDAVYTEYNRIQQQGGFDLLPYAGKRAVRYTFAVNNFDGAEGVRADVLIYKGKVIGGDLMTVAIDGFMIPLTKR